MKDIDRNNVRTGPERERDRLAATYRRSEGLERLIVLERDDRAKFDKIVTNGQIIALELYKGAKQAAGVEEDE